MKQKSFDPCSFFRVASTVIVELEVLYHNSSVSVASAKAQVSITTLLQQSYHCCTCKHHLFCAFEQHSIFAFFFLYRQFYCCLTNQREKTAFTLHKSCTQSIVQSALSIVRSAQCAQHSALSIVRSAQYAQHSALSIGRSAQCAQHSALSIVRSAQGAQHRALSIGRSAQGAQHRALSTKRSTKYFSYKTREIPQMSSNLFRFLGCFFPLERSYHLLLKVMARHLEVKVGQFFTHQARKLYCTHASSSFDSCWIEKRKRRNKSLELCLFIWNSTQNFFSGWRDEGSKKEKFQAENEQK